MITKSIPTEHGTVTSTADITHTDNGQMVIYIVSKLGDTTHEHRVTVGAEDGKDAIGGIHHCSTCGKSEVNQSISAMSETALQALIQKHLDAKRNEAVAILTGRATVAKISGNLI